MPFLKKVLVCFSLFLDLTDVCVASDERCRVAVGRRERKVLEREIEITQVPR